MTTMREYVARVTESERESEARAFRLIRAAGLEVEEIQGLRREAGEAGDREQVRICDRALDGDEAAITECARVIRAARDQQ